MTRFLNGAVIAVVTFFMALPAVSFLTEAPLRPSLQEAPGAAAEPALPLPPPDGIGGAVPAPSAAEPSCDASGPGGEDEADGCPAPREDDCGRDDDEPEWGCGKQKRRDGKGKGD